MNKIDKYFHKYLPQHKKGKVVVISAPSGTGKTTVCKYLLKHIPNLKYSVSYTTREKRVGEINGRDYFFVSEETFKKMVQQNKFIEWAKVHNHYYGTPKKFVEETINHGQDILLDIDVQGGKNMKKVYPDGVYIFLLPPSLQVLKQRLLNRGKDTLKDIKVRLKNAIKELEYIKYYDYVVINDKLKETLEIIKSIIISEKYRIFRRGK